MPARCFPSDHQRISAGQRHRESMDRPGGRPRLGFAQQSPGDSLPLPHHLRYNNHAAVSLLPESQAMNTQQVRIVELGRGPQIEGHRLTVMDVFYYLHRGYDFDFIHRVMPSLAREQFDAVVAYVNEHHAELVEKDRQAEEFHQRGIAAQRARGGIFSETAEHLTTEERVARLREKMTRRLAEKNGARHPVVVVPPPCS